MERDTLAIGTLRCRSASDDAPAVRLRVARSLQAADVIPSALPPAAVLVVRRMSDPLPGRFGGRQMRPPREWEAAVRNGLAATARTAARPDERGRLPAGADAVLFADEAELLACLLADRIRGDLIAHWWWRSVLPRLGLPAAPATDRSIPLGSLLSARPRELPSA